MKQVTILPKSKAIILSGPLGSGKTTFLNLLLKTQKELLGETGLLINDVGLQNIDSTRVSTTDIRTLTDGCVCCEDISELEANVRKMMHTTNTLLIEPTGIANPGTIKELLTKLQIRSKIVTLIPLAHLEKIQTSPTLKKILDEQIQSAQLLGFTRTTNTGDEERIATITTEHPHKPTVMIPFAPEVSGEIFQDDTDLRRSTAAIVKRLLHHEQKQLTFFPSQHMCESGCKHEHHHISNPGSANTHKIKTVTVVLSDMCTRDDLENFFKQHRSIVRAKGTLKDIQGNVRTYNYTLGSFELGGKVLEHGPSNFIGEEDMEDQAIAALGYQKNMTVPTAFSGSKLENSGTPLSFYKTAQVKELQENAEKRLSELIEQYKKYMSAYERKEVVQKQLRDGDKQETVVEEITELEIEMKEIGDAMTFEDPLIWMMYKHKAYAGGQNAISTLEDLVAHCFKQPGYICGKRYSFLTQQIKKNLHKDLCGEPGVFVGKTPLSTVYASDAVLQLLASEDFCKKWQEYEFYIHNNHVAKWENYEA